jgi:uncharacterized protein YlzI (FlbEa/FlbD family)
MKREKLHPLLLRCRAITAKALIGKELTINTEQGRRISETIIDAEDFPVLGFTIKSGNKVIVWDMQDGLMFMVEKVSTYRHEVSSEAEAADYVVDLLQKMLNHGNNIKSIEIGERVFERT